MARRSAQNVQADAARVAVRASNRWKLSKVVAAVHRLRPALARESLLGCALGELREVIVAAGRAADLKQHMTMVLPLARVDNGSMVFYWRSASRGLRAYAAPRRAEEGP